MTYISVKLLKMRLKNPHDRNVPAECQELRSCALGPGLSRSRPVHWGCHACPCSPRSSAARKQQAHESARPLSVERPGAVHPWVSAQLRNAVQPSHLFIQDPTMPPNPAPNPLTQLEEARRRLEEEERASKLPSKQR